MIEILGNIVAVIIVCCLGILFIGTTVLFAVMVVHDVQTLRGKR